MHRYSDIAAGAVDILAVDGRSLAGNLLGEPTGRRVAVWRPRGHDGRGLPLLVVLAGYTGSGLGMAGWRAFGESLPERLDRLTTDAQLPPVVVAMPDAFTRLGGNQYVNSAAMGRWEDYLILDMLPVVERTYGCGGPGRRGVMGKSSGGFGAIQHALRRADVWSAAACHSGDMGFDWVYLPEMPGALRVLARHGGSIETFLAAMATHEAPDGDDISCLMTLGMCATYDPDAASPYGIRLPVETETCELITERWANWLAWDPVRIVEAGPGPWVDNLKALKALYIDCGTRDQFNILYGCRRFVRALNGQGVAHRYEEFPGTHSNVGFRMDISLPAMAAALSGED